ncbi:hypothetical protein PFISCL1PPCAC_26048, partial [Pristionchus fissidentatus]
GGSGSSGQIGNADTSASGAPTTGEPALLPVRTLVLIEIRAEFVGLQTELALKRSVIAVLDGVLFEVPNGVEQLPAVLQGALLVLLQRDVDVLDLRRTDDDGRQWGFVGSLNAHALLHVVHGADAELHLVKSVDGGAAAEDGVVIVDREFGHISVSRPFHKWRQWRR